MSCRAEWSLLLGVQCCLEVMADDTSVRMDDPMVPRWVQHDVLRSVCGEHEKWQNTQWITPERRHLSWTHTTLCFPSSVPRNDSFIDNNTVAILPICVWPIGPTCFVERFGWFNVIWLQKYVDFLIVRKSDEFNYRRITTHTVMNSCNTGAIVVWRWICNNVNMLCLSSNDECFAVNEAVPFKTGVKIRIIHDLVTPMHNFKTL